MLVWPVGDSGEVVRFADTVLVHFEDNRQRRLWHREAGGQLFAEVTSVGPLIVRATGPRTSDRRTRYSHAACRTAAQAEVDALHLEGLHYVGDWHTHPQRIPAPSWRDRLTMASRMRLSQHQLGGMIFVIVGTADFPAGLAVLVHDGAALHRLAPAKA